MLINARIDNLMGIENEIVINCLSNNKIKRRNKAIIQNPDDISILKTIGIIGSNGSGKTSFLTAIAAVQTFINFPFRKSSDKNKSFIEQIKNLPPDLLNQLLDDLNTLKLPEQNVNRQDEITTIELDIYINEEKDNVPGYYTYKIKYDKNYKVNGVIEESLFYRKTYNSKRNNQIFLVNNVFESELGTKLLYQNNTLNSNNDKIKFYHSIGNKLINKCDFVFDGEGIDILKFYKNDKSRFVKLCNLADEKILDVRVEKKDKREFLYFINNKGNQLRFEQLSEGTKKIIVLGCKIIDALENNEMIFVDEIEKSLHPSLANLLVLLMQLPIKNSYSQLFFTTHSIYLAMLLDNDQLYYIDNRFDNYNFSSINDAIKKKIITKDKTITAALVDNLLINNPSMEKINNFINGK